MLPPYPENLANLGLNGLHVQQFVSPELILFQPVVGAKYLLDLIALPEHPVDRFGVRAGYGIGITPSLIQASENSISLIHQWVRRLFSRLGYSSHLRTVLALT